MRRRQVILAALAGGLTGVGACSESAPRTDVSTGTGAAIALPSPVTTTAGSVTAVLAARRSVRAFTAQRLTRQEVAHLLWAAQGVTSGGGLRTAPSAGALYPLTVSVALPEGLYRYLPADHRLLPVADRDLRAALAEAALGQEWIGSAAAVFAISGDVSTTAVRYGGRAERYVQMEAGHAAENLLLQAVALDLGATPVGAFDDDRVRGLLGLPDGETPLHLLPVGHPKP